MLSLFGGMDVTERAAQIPGCKINIMTCASVHKILRPGPASDGHRRGKRYSGRRDQASRQADDHDRRWAPRWRSGSLTITNGVAYFVNRLFTILLTILVTGI
jgi:hypothetical protein